MNINMNSKLIIYLGMMLAFLTACSSEKPTHLEPHLATLPASDITRNEAILHGLVSLEGETIMPTLTFRYGETEEWHSPQIPSIPQIMQDNPHLRK